MEDSLLESGAAQGQRTSALRWGTPESLQGNSRVPRRCCCFRSDAAHDRSRRPSARQIEYASVGWRALSGTFWLSVLTMLWASFCFGMLFGSLSPVLANDCYGPDGNLVCPECLNCDLGLATEPGRQAFWILVGPLSTVLLGPVGVAALDRRGHRLILFCGGTLYCLGWLLAVATPGERGFWRPRAEGPELGWTYSFIFGGRLLTWAGFATMCGVPMLYLAEITPQELRGAVGAGCHLAVILGTLTEFGVGAILVSWRWLYAINGLAFVPCMLLVGCIPTSPRWLHSAHLRRRREAGISAPETIAEDETEVHRALARLYSPFVDLTPLFAEIVTDLRTGEHENPTSAVVGHAEDGSDVGDSGVVLGSSGRQVAGKGCSGLAGCCIPMTAQEQVAFRQLKTPIAMCALLSMTMQLSPGGTIVVLFSGPILEGFAPVERNMIALLCNAAALPGALLALFLAGRVGRRKLLITSALGQCLAALALGTLFLLKIRKLSLLEGRDLTMLAALALATVQFA